MAAMDSDSPVLGPTEVPHFTSVSSAASQSSTCHSDDSGDLAGATMMSNEEEVEESKLSAAPTGSAAGSVDPNFVIDFTTAVTKLFANNTSSLNSADATSFVKVTVHLPGADTASDPSRQPTPSHQNSASSTSGS
ncbi:hypothetical protein AX15_006554 [Amanita polypyramis BW_CC]|nr:hypothetical protein AX15_006554 [Amanita polypyramis BW_CC]